MRCPHCGSLNPDTTRYCIRCGRNITAPQSGGQQQRVPAAPQHRPEPMPMMPMPPVPQQAPAHPSQQRYTQPVYPPRPVSLPPSPGAPAPLPQQEVVVRPALRPEAPQVARQRATTAAASPVAVSAPPATSAIPEPPAPFPPRTLAQLQAIESAGAQPYTLLSDDTSYGKKKFVRIAYRGCSAWQQMATLLKAFHEYDDSKYETVVIQGLHDAGESIYSYTNGQLVFDRNARLGSQMLQRYQIETDTGFSTDAVRVVLSE